MNDTISKFIQEFEKRHGHLLLNPPQIDNPILQTKFFRIYNDKEKQKYSDWDLECWLKPDVLEADVKQIEEFVRSLKGFSDVGHLLTFSEKYRSWHFQHAATTPGLVLMGFMVNEPFAPFLDFHAFFSNTQIIERLYTGKDDNEIESWLIITAWRKLLNGDLMGALGFVGQYIAPIFPDEVEKIRSDLISCFKMQFSNKRYRKPVDFLLSGGD
ncbi:hypothetical protein HYU82_02180 [Candidatus Saccharibacteria bacterium]|nr:hypothetical protein [Candidatus Saccharibacteria bacterium]